MSRFWKPGAPTADRQNDDGSVVVVNNRHKNWSIEEQRLSLPIYEFRRSILYALEVCQTVVLVAETGTGKSTQIPQYLYEAGWTSNAKGIAITQPRRVAAMTIAARVAQEMKCELGNEVGYAVRFEQKSSPRTVIKYCTDGALLRETMVDPLLSSYNVIMVDEAHERSLNTDIILGLLKKIVRKRRDLKIIVTSATIDAKEIKDFFEMKSNKPLIAEGDLKGTSDSFQDSACIISVKGETHPVDLLYLKKPCANYIQKAVDTVTMIHRFENPGDILVFLPGAEEIDTAVGLMKEQLESSKNDICIMPMYSSLPTATLLEVFEALPRGIRKVVVATNIAETSVTIEGVKYVVDSGFVRLNYFNVRNGVDALITCPESKAAAQQRAGRAGRTAPGKCFRLFPEDSFVSLPEHTTPEMQRAEIAWAVLQLKALGIDDVLHFDFLSPPSPEAMIFALELLFSLGALDEACKLTSTGEKMAEMPIEPRMSKCLLSSWDFGCGEELLSIAAMCAVEYPFISQRSRASQEAKSRLTECIAEFASPLGDHLTYLNIFRKYEESRFDNSWCDSFCLQPRIMSRAREIRGHLKNMLWRYRPEGASLATCLEDNVAVRKCLVSGFFANAAQLASDGNYRSIRGRVAVTVHPTSILSRYGTAAEWVIFNEIVQSKTPQIRDVTKIEPLWLMEIAHHYYMVTNIKL